MNQSFTIRRAAAPLALSILLAALLAVPVVADAPSPHYLSAQRKLRLITEGKAAPGSQVFLTRPELDAWLRQEAPLLAQRGITQARIESLGQNSAVASARLDLVRLKEHTGASFPSLLETMLSGNRPVRLGGRVKSARGMAQVNLEFVEISGIALPARVFEYLARSIVLKDYPDVHLGEPFELGYDLDRVAVTPEGVWLTVGAARRAAR